jgi:hypothetical protein
MDYARIYAEFIADRLAKQPEKPAYFEVHHIKPRSLGGGNEPENLIRLTPEDHFFAHLLIAKAHGGSMWAPIAFMVGGSRKDYKPTVSRKNHGWSARAMAKNRSGKNAHQFDLNFYELVNIDGREWVGLQSDMTRLDGVTKTAANMLIKGRISTARGWYLKGKKPKDIKGENHPMFRSESFNFKHIDGREFFGTQFDFVKTFGISKPCACRLVNNKQTISGGWGISGNSQFEIILNREKQKREKSELIKEYRSKGLLNQSDKNIYKWRDVKTGRLFEATKTEVRKLYGLRTGDVSTLFSGRQKTAKGVALVKP